MRPALLIFGLGLLFGCLAPPPEIRSFDECVKAGYPVMESFPRQCKAPDGRIFVSEKDRFDIGLDASCEADSGCVLANSELGFACCHAGACESADYSLGKWIAVNRTWYESGRSSYCPDRCGPAPGCDPMARNLNYTAKCISKQCRKVPLSCASDSDCGTGASCWARIPAGPSAGTRGSSENPGSCYDDAAISAIVSPVADKERCCAECARAFSTSPAGAGPDGVKCGLFSSSYAISPGCLSFFVSYPMTPSMCGVSAPPPPANITFTAGGCNMLLDSGPMEGKLNIIFLPSHHYSSMADFASDVPSFRDSLLAFPFYGSNQDKINMMYLAGTGASDGCGLAGNTTPFCDVSAMRSLASACNYSQSRGDQLVVLFDNRVIGTPFARGEGDDDILFIGSSASGIFAHEFSHSFGDLGDTYDGSWNNTADPAYPNCASDAPGFSCADKWGDLIGTGSGDQLVGCYANCHAQNWYRPTLGGDVMRDLSKDFYDPVSLRHMNALMSRYS